MAALGGVQARNRRGAGIRRVGFARRRLRERKHSGDNAMFR